MMSSILANMRSALRMKSHSGISIMSGETVGALGYIRNIGCSSASGSASEETDFKNRVRRKTPIGRLDDTIPSSQPPPPDSKSSASDPDPYAPFPDNTNPTTGEIGGPTGPEPTRYGDWERKGRVTDF